MDACPSALAGKRDASKVFSGVYTPRSTLDGARHGHDELSEKEKDPFGAYFVWGRRKETAWIERRNEFP